MTDERAAMSDEFKARMRRGLSSMAVRERVRERRRNRAIAGGAVAAVATIVVGIGVWQVAGAGDPRQDQAATTTTVEPTTASAPTTAPTPTPTPTSTPGSTPPMAPTSPPGFAGVAARQPVTYDSFDCGTDCGDTGAAGGAGAVERTYDVYAVCEGQGTVSFGGELWLDCSALAPGTGYASLGVQDTFGDGDPRFAASSDFTGQLSVVDAGAPSAGSIDVASATVFVECSGRLAPSVTVGGVVFECDPALASQSIAAWGVPILPGEIAPRIEGASALRYVLER